MHVGFSSSTFFFVLALTGIVAASPSPQQKDLDTTIRRWDFKILAYPKPECDGDLQEIRMSSGYTCTNLTAMPAYSLRISKQAGCVVFYYPGVSCEGPGAEIKERCDVLDKYKPDALRKGDDCTKETSYGCWGWDSKERVIGSFSSDCPAQIEQQWYLDSVDDEP